jgi:hypothetical protein
VRVGKLERAAVGVGIHGFELLLGHVLHSHPARVKRKSLGLYSLAGTQYGRNFGFHRGV